MAKQGCDEQKLDIRLLWLGNLALHRIARLQAEAHKGKSSIALRNFLVLPREILSFALCFPEQGYQQ